MKKKSGKTLMQKWKNKIGGKLSALDKKKLVLTNLPYVLTAFYADRASCLYRSSPGEDIGNKLLYAMEHADRIFTGILLSFDLRDLLVGVTVAVILKLLVWQKQSDAKKLRKGIEYGSARWGTAEDIKPYMSEDPWMNIPLTATEALTMESRPKQPKYARNKNIVVIGGSGSGKTRFFVKPSVMQMNCSMVITDPKGTLIEECGKMLAKGPPKKDKNGNIMKDKSGKVVHEPYVIKVLNTINFSKSLHYNPFAYIRSEKDILKLVTTIIVNTKGEGEKASEDFWVKAEKLLYTALIAFIWYEGDEEEKNLNTLLDLLNESETAPFIKVRSENSFSENNEGFSENNATNKSKVNKSKVKENKGKETVCAETETASAPKPLFPILLNDGSLFGFTKDQIAEWEELYLGVDVEQAMRNMQAWCKANPTRRKTKSGIMRFVTNWLASDQNSGRNKRRKSADNTYDGADDFCALMEDKNGD